MLQTIKCIFGFHAWQIVREIDVPGSTSTQETSPVEWEVGGIDYECRCASCGATQTIEKRGAWIRPDYPNATKEA